MVNIIHLKTSCFPCREEEEEVIMSFFRDIQHFAGQSLSSINASARKLASSISTESNGSNDMTGPNIEVSDASSSELKKRPGPLLIRSPEVKDFENGFVIFGDHIFFPSILGRCLNAIKSRRPF